MYGLRIDLPAHKAASNINYSLASPRQQENYLDSLIRQSWKDLCIPGLEFGTMKQA